MKAEGEQKNEPRAIASMVETCKSPIINHPPAANIKNRHQSLGSLLSVTYNSTFLAVEAYTADTDASRDPVEEQALALVKKELVSVSTH